MFQSACVRGTVVTVCIAVTTMLAGWSAPAHSTMSVDAARTFGLVSLAGLPSVPVQPKPFSIPAQPIVAASSDGYLPSSWEVTPKGEFNLTLPFDVPPGRAGMQPELSLDYSSATGNGIAGVGWSMSGFSTITRGGRAWAQHGASDGVDFTTRDRFYLDGQELVGVDATPYGGNGAEYRTALDTFVRVRSTSAAPLDAKGPEQFTVELGDGRIRTYAPIEAQQIAFDDDNHVFAHGPVRAEWRIVSEQDASGNTISYEYQDSAGPGGANASDYWYESVPAKIYYTANLTNGIPTHGIQDLPQRYVAFEYENRPDTSMSWQAGVQRRHSVRLKTLRMYAPNPTATALVWQYNLAYTLGGSQRSLLSSAQRCEAAGGCLWAKQFTWSPTTGNAQFQAQPVQAAPIMKTDYDLAGVSAPDGEAPAMQWLDLNGDGASDLLFGLGANTLWERKYYPAPFDVWLPDGKYLGGSHSLWLSGRDANGRIIPLSQGLSLARDEEPLASAHYGHVRLDQSTSVDLDGDGKAELVAAIDNLGAHEVNVDPNLPPLYGCSFADLKWTPSGFVRQHVVPCTVLGTMSNAYTYYMPNEFPTFADVNGDGLPDRLWPYNTAGWVGSNNPNDEVTLEFSPAWQVALNATSQPGVFGPPVKHDKFEESSGVVTDLDGDGRAELTSEALKSSLTFDDQGQWAKQTPDSIHQPLDAQSKPLDGYREFGDFNGDGTEDLLRLTQADPQRPGTLTGQIFWNTGKGFFADSHLLTVQVDVHPDVDKHLPTRFADPGLHVTDVDNNGRMDLVIFNNDHVGANQQPAPQIVFLFSNGDGTFGEVDLPVQLGTRDDVKFWLDNALRPITFYPNRLENDRARLGIEAFGHVIPGAQILLQMVPFEDYLVVGGDNKTPGMAAGWNLSTLTDTNGDGLIDIVRHVGGNDPAGGFEVLQQTPQGHEELIAIADEASAWPVLSIDYSSEWSDRPEVNDSYSCTYPLSCPKNGLRVVRAITSRAALTDLPPGADPMKLGHTWEYAYRDPIANMQGLGFLGFSEFRVWDTEPTHPVETITTYDLRTADPGGAFYPGVGRPAKMTIAQPILQPGQGMPVSAIARIVESTYAYETRVLNGGATHAIFAQTTQSSEWEQPVAISAAGLGPDHLHVSGYAEPASPPIHVDAHWTHDDYGNVIDALTQTAKGLTTEVQSSVINDTVSWHLGLVSMRAVKTLESTKNAVPVWRTTDYTYTSKGQLETVTREKASGDPALVSQTAITYDDYGLITDTTTTADGEAPRTQHVAYANAWPGAPDEHLFASVAWADHDNALCAVDCRPAAWLLMHPAYGLPIAALDRNGVETVRTYDAHGRPVTSHSDGELPLSVAYAGRPDAFGGMNGLQATATSGMQQVLKTFDGRGAPLRWSFVGFDGQWINTFATYDAVGRRTATSRPSAGAPTAWTVDDYDSLGRNVATKMPDGSNTTRNYTLLQNEQIDPAGHYNYQIRDVDGRLIESGTQLPPAAGCGVCLAQNVGTTFEYTATSTGAVSIARDDQGHATQTQYDRRGRAVRQDDPSRGTTTVSYNGFGEPRATVHVATGQTETLTWDDLGRVLTTTTPDGLTTYSWDLAAHGIGRLARAMSADQIRTDYRYDDLGRVAGIDQTDDKNQAASIDLQYDAQTGRLSSVDYPQAPGQAARFRAGYAYNGYGYLTTVSDATPNQPARVLQQIVARNADLALVDAIRGIDNGVGGGAISDHRDYDPLMGRLWAISAQHAGANRLKVAYNYDADGLVQQRITTDEVVQIDETFEHDALHRLTHSTRNGMPLQNGLPFSASVDETYDTVGNRIDTSRNGQLVEHRSYGNNGLQPYALTERAVNDPANPNLPPHVEKFEYDELGRLKQDPHRTLAWTAFDLPRSITRDGQTWTFRYGAGDERVRKIGPDGTTTYFAGLYEKHEDAAATRHVFHVVGSDEAVADVIYTEAAKPILPGTIDVRYPLTDALGSIYAVVDAHGTVAERDYYDLWGQRSNPDGTPIDKPTFFQSLVSAGFTNQEHDDALGLVNMQGRIYDAVLGRFLSPDPIVGNPAFSQSWNAYSYVLNSPLNFVDPSGFDCSSSTTVSDGGKTTSTVTGCHDELAGGGNVGATAASAVSGAFAMMDDLKRLAEQEHALAVARGRELPDGTRIRSADGTPILPHRINPLKGNRVEDNWGYPIRGHVHGPAGTRNNAPPVNTDGLLSRKAADFSVRLFCGSKCASASAPTSPEEAARAPKQLSDARIARNALSQALAARSLVKFLGKVGVIIDEGVDGIVERLMPEGMAMQPYHTNLQKDHEAYVLARRFRESPEVARAMRQFIWARNNLSLRRGSQSAVEEAREGVFKAVEEVIGRFDRERGRTATPFITDDDPPSTDPEPPDTDPFPPDYGSGSW